MNESIFNQHYGYNWLYDLFDVLISKTVTLEMFDALQARMREEELNSNPDEEWPSVLQRLEKPSDDNVKRGKNNEDEER